jgi:uncharacterized protein
LRFYSGAARGGEADARDWDLAVSFTGGRVPRAERLGQTERLRSRILTVLDCPEDRLDLVELHRAGLGILATVAEEGILLKGGDTLDAFRFYQRAWRGLEEFHFRKAHGL